MLTNSYIFDENLRTIEWKKLTKMNNIKGMLAKLSRVLPKSLGIKDTLVIYMKDLPHIAHCEKTLPCMAMICQKNGKQ